MVMSMKKAKNTDKIQQQSELDHDSEDNLDRDTDQNWFNKDFCAMEGRQYGRKC